MLHPEEISVYRVPIPASEEDVAKYAQIRLATLKTDPEAFSTTFEEVALFTAEQWKMRVETPGRTTFAACQIATHSGTEDYNQWIGTLSVLHPKLLESAPVPLPKIPRVAEALASEQLFQYMIVGLWVHPCMRKRNVGKTLIQAALDLVKSESRIAKKSGGAVSQQMLMLSVRDANRAAKALYGSMGFKEEMDCENVENGSCVMSITVC